jgi:hypothetical protein
MMVLTGRGQEHWNFEGVEHVRWINNVCTLPGPPGFGSMGYEEIELDDAARIVLRVLFSTGLELHVVFRAFRLSHDAPPSGG